MKKWFPFFVSIYLALSLIGVAQDGYVDSLKKVIATAPDDSIKVDNLIELSRRLAGVDPTSGINYGTEAHDLAKTINYQKGLAQALKWIGIGYYYQAKYLDALDFWIIKRRVIQEVKST